MFFASLSLSPWYINIRGDQLLLVVIDLFSLTLWIVGTMLRTRSMLSICCSKTSCSIRSRQLGCCCWVDIRSSNERRLCRSTTSQSIPAKFTWVQTAAIKRSTDLCSTINLCSTSPISAAQNTAAENCTSTYSSHSTKANTIPTTTDWNPTSSIQSSAYRCASRLLRCHELHKHSILQCGWSHLKDACVVNTSTRDVPCSIDWLSRAKHKGNRKVLSWSRLRWPLARRQNWTIRAWGAQQCFQQRRLQTRAESQRPRQSEVWARRIRSASAIKQTTATILATTKLKPNLSSSISQFSCKTIKCFIVSSFLWRNKCVTQTSWYKLRFSWFFQHNFVINKSTADDSGQSGSLIFFKVNCEIMSKSLLLRI